ncbi:EVE domain-containing protein [Parasutterella sp.]|uniref:EVE domain-containing protein n=1 Tax=Parasutterella sp. TaxID=2049037 RepID=UPI003AF1C88C
MAGFEHYAWLMKSEPSEVSVDDVLQMDGCKVGWFGVRNYQARNQGLRMNLFVN